MMKKRRVKRRLEETENSMILKMVKFKTPQCKKYDTSFSLSLSLSLQITEEDGETERIWGELFFLKTQNLSS